MWPSLGKIFEEFSVLGWFFLLSLFLFLPVASLSTSWLTANITSESSLKQLLKVLSLNYCVIQLALEN